ncbi:MAG: methionine adenosyltransferase [Candidatus Aenigmarchaeota archaeon]|nr:methionine adenosyltransferase [Candidatus Aenigmarchaeota archaeon]
MNNLMITKRRKEEPLVEIVERKGIGHPDTISDNIVEKISVNLANLYLKEVGQILHYNIDKAFLIAGESQTKFGGGKLVKPMKFVIGDRATMVVGDKEIPVNELVEKTVIDWFKENMRFVDKDHVIIQNEIKRGSQSLTTIFKGEKQKFMPANDTSALVGFAPLTKLEDAVYKIERFINSPDFKKRHPESGEDVKVMGLRMKDHYRFTIAIAFVDRFIENETNYFRKKDEVFEEIKNYVNNDLGIDAEILVNTLDTKGLGEDGCYLTVLGTSADSGDSGEVGRGNRANGLISLNRPAGSEAAAGKNMVSHVGKIYNLLAFKIAREIHAETGKENYVWLLSQIGKPINEPVAVSVEVVDLEDERPMIEEVVARNFEKLDEFISDLIKGKYTVA